MKKDLMKVYEIDASRFKGSALDVVHPATIMEVRSVVARAKRIVLRGAGTGLAGGCVPLNGLDVVLDMSKINQIGNFNSERRTVEVEAGVILDDLQSYLAKKNLEFPVNLLNNNVCTIGGMIAMDIAGSRAVKYGKTSNWIKWVDVVDGYGNLHRKGVTELSDYAGMEGITGVIVKACLKLSPLKKRTASLIKVESLEEVVLIVRNLKRNPAVSMIDFLDKKISKGLELTKDYYLIVEYEDGSGLLKGKEYEDLMEMSDKVYSFVVNKGYTRIEDFRIMIDKFVKLMGWLEGVGIPTFGHIGIGILHPCFGRDDEKFIPEMMKLVKRLGGQISGEYGVGILKIKFVEEGDKRILINVKKRTDSLNKFNVGKMI
ncbi:FAD-binding oxidoreductase [Candidatus Pacearchaeota archaeon]|nr:FAD-binding oxidoreductase [Candidatus Pacearchaeota archaeon]